MSPSASPPPKSFLDTSTVIKLQLGASIQRDYLFEAIPRKWYINNYVRMEFYRRVIIECIEVYFESADSRYTTLGDVFSAYAERFGRQAKIATNVMANMKADGYSLSEPKDKEVLRQKLQDFIFSLALQFREAFIDMGKDPSQCSRVPRPIRLPKEPSDRDAVLRAAALTFAQKEECRRRCTVHHLFQSQPYTGKLEAISGTTANDASLEKIRKATKTARENPSRITCASCSKMGDAIIAISLDPAWRLHSMDGVHQFLSEAINLEFKIHPSVAALMRLSSKGSVAGGEPSSTPSGTISPQ